MCSAAFVFQRSGAPQRQRLRRSRRGFARALVRPGRELIDHRAVKHGAQDQRAGRAQKAPVSVPVSRLSLFFPLMPCLRPRYNRQTASQCAENIRCGSPSTRGRAASASSQSYSTPRASSNARQMREVFLLRRRGERQPQIKTIRQREFFLQRVAFIHVVLPLGETLSARCYGGCSSHRQRRSPDAPQGRPPKPF